MKPGWEESDYVFCDLQDVARQLRRHDPKLARRFLARNAAIGRPRPDLGFENLRSWHIFGIRRILIFYCELPDHIQIWRVLHGARDLQKLVPPSDHGYGV